MTRRGKYPSEFGIPLDVHELKLPKSKLNTSLESNWSWHHYFFEKSYYVQKMGSLILKNLRDLEFSQVHMLNDQHNLGKLALHALYEPPEPPTLIQAMDRLDIAYNTNERLHVRDEDGDRGWVYQNLTSISMKQMAMEYNRNNQNKRV